MNENRAELEREYRRAVYVVSAETGEIHFHIGEFAPEMDALLARCSAENFTFITAYNPRSKVLTAAENKRRCTELKKLLNDENFRFLEGYGTDEDKKWGRELSLLVLNISEEKACEIARKFEQNAIVCGAIGEKSRLVWVN